MNRLYRVRPEFVETIPDELGEGIIYVCIRYATIVHRCCCGCGYEAVTPLAPKEWSLTFDGETISLRPSVGNWSFPCQSHYWIRNNEVQWAPQWTKTKIEDSRRRDATERQRVLTPTDAEIPMADPAPSPGRVGRFVRKFRRPT